MTRQAVIRAFEKHGDFLHVQEIADILGLDRGTVRPMLCGLEYVPFGKKKKYFKADVVDRLMERKTI